MASRVHSLNSSSAHQKYSFSKQKRLKYDLPKTQNYYLPRIDKDNRSALIGYGQRSLCTIKEKMAKITPHAYSIPSQFDKKKGNAFSSGRHETGGPFESLKYLKQCPSPLNYKVQSSLDKKGGKFGSRLQDFSLRHLNGLPGPGAYTLPSTIQGSDGVGRRINQSRFSSGGSYKMGGLNNSMQLMRENPNKFQVPGPGQYNTQKYGLSNPENPLQKHSSVKFTKEKRAEMGKRGSQNEPGPGAYKAYSQFD